MEKVNDKQKTINPEQVKTDKSKMTKEELRKHKRKEKNKKKALDKYGDHLLKLLFKIEEAYCINRILDNGLDVSKLGIIEFSKVITSDVKSLNKKEITSRNVKTGGLMASVSYINQILKFKNLKKLDYTVYIGMDKLVGTLEKFLYKETSTKRALLEINALMNLLKQREAKHVNCNLTLAYRYLRIFYVLIAYDNRIDASIVADLILTQVKIGFEKKSRLESKGA